MFLTSSKRKAQMKPKSEPIIGPIKNHFLSNKAIIPTEGFKIRSTLFPLVRVNLNTSLRVENLSLVATIKYSPSST